MSDIKLVIKIPEYRYNSCKANLDTLDMYEALADAVKNGKLIPKGHRVIDADEILNHAFIREDEEGDIFVQKYYCVEKEIVDNALIEADKE